MLDVKYNLLFFTIVCLCYSYISKRIKTIEIVIIEHHSNKKSCTICHTLPLPIVITLSDFRKSF